MRPHLLSRCRALAIGVLALIGTLPASAAGASSPWRVTLVHQDPVATLDLNGHANVTVTLRTGGLNGDEDALDVAIYPLVSTRSALAAIVSGIGVPSQPLSETGDFPLSCRSAGVARLTLTITEHTQVADTTCGQAQPDLALNCHDANCDGVYPVALRITNGTQLRTIWSLLTVTSSAIEHPVGLAWVLRSNPVSSTATRRESSVLNVLAENPSVPLSVAVNYSGIANVNFALNRTAANFRDAMARALRSTHHELTDAPPASVDFGSLRQHGFAADVVAQASYGASLVREFTGKAPRGPKVLTGSISLSDLRALNTQGVRNVVIGDDALSVAPATTLQWGTPFHLSGVGSALTVLSADEELSRLSQSSLSPGLRSALMLGTLSLMHFQAPFAPTTRVAVIESPLASIGASFTSDFLAGLRHDPLIKTVSLSHALSPSLIGANGYPRERTLAPTAGAVWTRSDTSSTALVDAYVGDFQASISSAGPIVPLRIGTLLAERKNVPGGRTHALAVVSELLAQQLRSFRIVNTTITLTGSGAPLPITLTSSAGYTVTGVLSLSAPNVTFPEGNRTVITLDAATRAVRVPADIHGSGNFTLVVELLTTRGNLVLAHGAIQVRSTATSALGYILTFAALAVIVVWWYRTTRRRSRGLHAA